MDNAIHHFHDLFAQLGLPSDAQSIANFLTDHATTVDSLALPDADYWTPSQAAFLREALIEDADWAILVDQLSKALIKVPCSNMGEPCDCDSSKFAEGGEDPEQSAELERQQDT